MRVRVWDRDGTELDVSGWGLRPVRYGLAAQGGPTTAEIVMEGPGLGAPADALRFEVRVETGQGTPVWWGFVEEVITEANGGERRRSLAEMANKARVLYSYVSAGEVQTGETDWEEDDESVLRYGTRELQETLGDATVSAATARRGRLLAVKGQPSMTLRLRQAGAGQAERVTRWMCRGWAATLGWKYFGYALGREEYWDAVESGSMRVGWGFTSTKVGFGAGAMHEIDGKLGAVRTGEGVRVSGSTSNDGVKEITGGSSGEMESYTAATISFDAADDIMDSAAGLGFVRVDEMILVSGSASNNGYHLVDSAGTDHITIDTGWRAAIVTAGAGASVTIRRGTRVEYESSLTNEAPGASTTVTGVGSRLAQLFTPEGTWDASRVGVRAGLVGAPADDLRLRLYTTTSGGVPNALLATAIIDGALLGESATEVWADLDSATTLTNGVMYALVVERTGSNGATDYFVVSIDEAGGGGGFGLVWDGAAWQEPDPTIDVLFGVWAAEDTAVQAERILSTAGQFWGVVDRRASSGVLTNQYRDGTRTGADELRDLLEAGTDDGGRLLWRVGVGRNVVLYDEPVWENDTELRWDLRRGALLTPTGERAEEGVLPAGQWIGVVDGLEVEAMFVEEGEFDVERGTMLLTSRGVEVGLGVVNG